MRIDETRSDSVKPGSRPVAPVEPARPVRAVADREAATSDRVDISAEARALAARQAAGSDVPGTLSPERLGELRRWVHSGAFNEQAVVETVARRLIERGLV